MARQSALLLIACVGGNIRHSLRDRSDAADVTTPDSSGDIAQRKDRATGHLSKFERTRQPGKTGRVLHLLKVFRPDFTGAGIFLERATLLFDQLAPGVEHDLLVVDTPRPAAPVRALSRLRNIIYLQDAQLSPWRVEFALVRWLLFNARRYDVVHFHTHADRFLFGYLLAKLLGKRLVMTATLDDSAPKLLETYRRPYRPLVRTILRFFDAFIAISPKLYEESLPVLGPDKVHFIPIGVAIPSAPDKDRQAKRTAHGLSGEDVVLIFVGGICARKDPMFLVEQMPAVCKFSPHAKLIIVGPILETDHYARMLDYIEQHNLKDHVVFKGEVLDPYPFFAIADIVVFASHLEGFGCAVTEGMAHGLPAVCRHLPRVNDLFIRDGKTGFFFTSPTEYLSAIRKLVEDPALRQDLGATARELIAAEFSNFKNAERIMSVYGFMPEGEARQAP